MTRMFKSIPVLALFLFALTSMGALALVGPHEETAAETSGDAGSSETRREYVEATNVAIPKPRQQKIKHVDEKPEDTYLWQNYPNVCESFTVIQGTKRVKNRRGEWVYPTNHRRNRFHRKRSDQRRTAALVRMVAQEMGADIPAQYLVGMMAHHEASYNSEAIHILNGDLDANQEAWRKHSYSRSLELSLEAKMRASSQKDNRDGYYGLKRRLADVRLYKGNPHWKDKLRYTHQVPERTYGGESYDASEWQESRSVWQFGYGLYGMNAVLYTHVWDRTAPPWILCGDEGIVATITAVWALRDQQADCQYLTDKDPDKFGSDGGTIKGILHRWGSGHCRKGRPGKAWRKLMPQYAEKIAKRYKAYWDSGKVTYDWETVPDFGDKFQRWEMYKKGGKWRYRKDENGRRIPTDRMAVLEHMRKKAEEKGLLRPEPLKRKTPGSEPEVIPGGTVEVVASR